VVVPAAHQSGPLKGPLVQAPPRSRVHASLERAPPHSRVHSPLERAPPRSRLPHAHVRSRTRVRAFNALTRQGGAIMRLGNTPRPCRTNSIGGTHPRHCGGLRCGRRQPRDTTPPTPVRLTRRALEGGPGTPSNCFLVTLQDQVVTLGRRDAIPATIGPVRGTPRARSTTPGAVTTTPAP
jgi:hypothetical protein